MDGALDGGLDRGAELVDGTVRRPARAWTPSVHHLLEHLAAVGFAGARACWAATPTAARS